MRREEYFEQTHDDVLDKEVIHVTGDLYLTANIYTRENIRANGQTEAYNRMMRVNYFSPSIYTDTVGDLFIEFTVVIPNYTNDLTSGSLPTSPTTYIKHDSLLTLMPVSKLLDLKENDKLTWRLEAVEASDQHGGVNPVILELTLYASQLRYKYANKGPFEQALKNIIERHEKAVKALSH